MKIILRKVTAALSAAEVNYSLDFDGYIGIELTEKNWSWFIIAKDGLIFDYTYSQNTGRSKKRLIHRLRKYAALERVIGFDVTSISEGKKATKGKAPGKVTHTKGSIKQAAAKK